MYLSFEFFITVIVNTGTVYFNWYCIPIQVNTHTAVNTHTHTHTHTEQCLCCAARGAVGGSVPCSRAPRCGIEGGESAVHSLPPPHLHFLPARDSNSQPFDYESDSTIRPRLPQLLLGGHSFKILSSIHCTYTVFYHSEGSVVHLRV